MELVPGALIDSHVHLWDLDRFTYPWLQEEGEVLRRNYLPSHLAQHQAGLGIAGSVFVQADCLPGQALAEARWVQQLAYGGAPIVGIVAGAQLEFADGLLERLEVLAEIPLVVGVRRLLQDEAAGFVTSDAMVAGTRQLAEFGLTMDLCIREWQLAEAAALVDACPAVEFVVDHLAKPTITNSAFAAWASDLARLAERPNVRCKLSGLATEADEPMRSAEALRPWLEHAIAVFGPERCMFGSDWPVLATARTYEWWVDVVLSVLSGLDQHERELVLNGTASETYDSRRRSAQLKEW